MVGNDVVDLDDPAIVDHHLRARFVERVLCDDERAALLGSTSPKVLLWSFFAAKEAAYKIVVKQARGTPPPFAHRLFVVSPELATVRHEGAVFALQVTVHDSGVHAVATTHGTTAIHGFEGGADARALLCQSIAQELDCPLATLQVVRATLPGSWDGFGPPAVTKAGARLPIDVSLSHDGRLVAFAWATGA